MKLHLGVEYNT